MNRRTFLSSVSAAPLVGMLAARDDAPRSPLGIGSSSYAIHARQNGREFLEPSRFLAFCRDRGAAGIQAPLGVLDADEARRVRESAERWEMYVEGSVALPKAEFDLDRFRDELRTVRACGGTIVRTYCHSGRRYEVFDSAEAYETFLARSRQMLQLAEPIARDAGVRLAVENHKDRESGQLADLLKELGSEALGATVDLGNDLALLERPEQTVRNLAPFALASHLKDAQLAETTDGFLLADVPLGEGFLDVAGLTRQLREANPRITMTLEMITRDPLRVPCLGEAYWQTSRASGRRLASMLRYVREHSGKPLPEIGHLSVDQRLALEDANVRKCLAFARSRFVGL
jgi:sugar phosphate isomerase/epimerase